MLKINKCVTPSPDQFYAVIKGMRLPFKSGDKSDSGIEYKGIDGELVEPEFKLGEKDKKLLLNLCKAGDSSHRKVLRQLPVIMDIKAPLYWWKQMDKYQIGTVTNSESSMHTITKFPFKIEDFSVENLVDDCMGAISDIHDQESTILGDEFFKHHILTCLNDLRDRYLELQKYQKMFENNDRSLAMAFTWNYFETDDEDYTTEKLIELAKKEKEKYWYAINELLPQSYNQTRCWSGNYETLVNIVNQRSGHKLGEWKTFIDYMLENVPYLKEIIEAVNGTR